MFRHQSVWFGRLVVSIDPGEYFVSCDDFVISTVLGSCVSVALYDPIQRCGGLNHFMLPGSCIRGNRGANTRYGEYAMEALISGMLKLGARKSELVVKVFGGASVLKMDEAKAGRIAETNVLFAQEYLRREGFRITASDVGGRMPRKIFLFAKSGKVLMKRLGGKTEKSVSCLETNYLRSLGEV